MTGMQLCNFNEQRSVFGGLINKDWIKTWFEKGGKTHLQKQKSLMHLFFYDLNKENVYICMYLCLDGIVLPKHPAVG